MVRSSSYTATTALALRKDIRDPVFKKTKELGKKGFDVTREQSYKLGKFTAEKGKELGELAAEEGAKLGAIAIEKSKEKASELGEKAKTKGEEIIKSVSKEGRIEAINGEIDRLETELNQQREVEAGTKTIKELRVQQLKTKALGERIQNLENQKEKIEKGGEFGAFSGV